MSLKIKNLIYISSWMLLSLACSDENIIDVSDSEITRPDSLSIDNIVTYLPSHLKQECYLIYVNHENNKKRFLAVNGVINEEY